jgi:ribosomal-protein-alanine N-acetyltransferase
MRAPAVLDTPRLRLRAPVQDDAASIFASYAQDAEVSRYTTWSPHTSVDVTRTWLEECAAGWRMGTAFSWLISLDDGARTAGMVELRRVGLRLELGYVLAQPYWGRGLMTEAAGAVVNWAVAQPQVYRVWATVDLENRASQRVLEKVGMTREGVLRRWLVAPTLGPVPRDVWCYARIREAE